MCINPPKENSPDRLACGNGGSESVGEPGAKMLTAEQNFRLLQEIEANRRFLLKAYQQNPKLLESAETRIKQLFEIPSHGVDNNLSSDLRPVRSGHSASCGYRTAYPLRVLSSERGISLVELIMFIVIVSVALAGILTVVNRVTSHSADTLVRKQALAIAESLLEEVSLMPFTYCDPDDDNAATAANAAGCASTPEASGSEAGETRTGDPQYDNVNDYAGFSMAGITDITNTAIANLAGYSASVAVVNDGATLGLADNTAALRMTVTVTAPDTSQIVLDGYRTRYAPNGVP